MLWDFTSLTSCLSGSFRWKWQEGTKWCVSVGSIKVCRDLFNRERVTGCCPVTHAVCGNMWWVCMSWWERGKVGVTIPVDRHLSTHRDIRQHTRSVKFWNCSYAVQLDGAISTSWAILTCMDDLWLLSAEIMTKKSPQRQWHHDHVQSLHKVIVSLAY